MAEIAAYTQEVQRLNIVSEPEEKYAKQPLAIRTNKYFCECLKAPTHYWGLEKVVIMLVGCQMSGKTHFTQKLQRTLARCVIQSRDFIRTSPQGVYTYDKAKEHKVHTKFYTQLKDLYNNKSWKILILDDANNSLEELMETLVFLESLEALVIPVVLEAPFRYIIDERLKEDKKGLKATDVYDAADNVYDCGELLFSAYDPIFLKKPTVDALMGGEDYQ